MLNTIAQHNAESILDITERIHKISGEKHWEIKAQCLEFAITVLKSYSNMAHLIAQNEVKGKGGVKKPTSPSGGDRNSVKGNLGLAVDIISNCFNLDSPKSVQKIGLFRLQDLLSDYKLLYPLYIDVLVQTEDEIKQIILSEDPVKQGEEIFYSQGNAGFNYKLKSDVRNFDCLLMANALIDIIVTQRFDSLRKEHMQIFMLCCGADPELTINQSLNTESWLKFFTKFKDFLLVSICDEDLVDNALVIMHNFLTASNLKHIVYEECKESLQKSMELLYDGNSQVCKDKFRSYMHDMVVARTEDTDNALKKFFKAILTKMSQENSETYLSSNIADVLDQLGC